MLLKENEVNVKDRCATESPGVQTICSLGMLACETTCFFCMKPRGTALRWWLLQRV